MKISREYLFLFNRYHFYLPYIELASGKVNASSLSLVGFDTRWKKLFTTFGFPVNKKTTFSFFRNILLFTINNIIFIYFFTYYVFLL